MIYIRNTNGVLLAATANIASVVQAMTPALLALGTLPAASSTDIIVGAASDPLAAVVPTSLVTINLAVGAKLTVDSSLLVLLKGNRWKPAGMLVPYVDVVQAVLTPVASWQPQATRTAPAMSANAYGGPYSGQELIAPVFDSPVPSGLVTDRIMNMQVIAAPVILNSKAIKGAALVNPFTLVCACCNSVPNEATAISVPLTV